MKKINLLLLILISTLSDTVAQQKATLHNGLILSRIKGKYGFKNSSGRMVIPAVYDAAFAFSEGLTPVKKNGKWFYIDTLGKAAHTDDSGKRTLFSMARPYFHGLAVVRYANNYTGGRLTFIDAGGGAAFVDFSADALTDMAPGFSIVRQGKKYQIVNTCLDYLLPDEYDHIDSFSNGYAKVIMDGHTIHLNPFGLCIKNCENMQNAELRESSNPELLYLSNMGLHFSDQSKVKMEALAKIIRQNPDKKYVV
ncbi:MAG: WG repeat-containing protein, partial [Chitinophagaceae bacterium]|nr:WG repeat-containing protein [Chitinophagaceae bacterium]